MIKVKVKTSYALSSYMHTASIISTGSYFVFATHGFNRHSKWQHWAVFALPININSALYMSNGAFDGKKCYPFITPYVWTESLEWFDRT